MKPNFLSFGLCLWLGCFALIPGSGWLFALTETTGELPAGFVHLSTVAPSIRQEIRYYGSNNFMGRPVAGYRLPVCILSKQAAQALSRVQDEVLVAGYSLKVYDCYRPQQAVDDFAAWARQPHELAMQPWFYPQVLKAVLFRQGYIAEKSGHSRGSTVDLTLVPVDSPQQPTQKHLAEVSADCRFPKHFRFRDESLDMGTAFDCFDPLSHTENTRISREARYNRLYLKQRMEAHGFRNLPEEWWHYTLVDEPFPNQYFNFPME